MCKRQHLRRTEVVSQYREAEMRKRLMTLDAPRSSRGSPCMTLAVNSRSRSAAAMSRISAFVAIIALTSSALVTADHSYGICTASFCKCIPAKHPSQTIVNCTVPKDETLTICQTDLPETTDTLVVTGGDSILMDVSAFSGLKDIRYIHLSRNKKVVIKSFAAEKLNIVNLYLDIEKCRSFDLEPKAFNNIKGPLSVSIRNCKFVNLGKEAFSWLLSIRIENIERLKLNTAAFVLDSTAANLGEHGPGMSIHMKNINATEIPEQTFGSSAALISFEKVVIGTVHTGAFTANTYNTVKAINCTIFRVKGDSFASQSLINNLYLTNCKIEYLETKAVQSAIVQLQVTKTRFENIQTGAINATVVAVVIIECIFRIFNERGFELSSWNKLRMERNSFDELAPNAIVAPGGSIHELLFADNEIETINPGSIGFIGQAYSTNPDNVIYKNNYFGQPCHCNMSSWIAKGLSAISGEPFENESYCTVDEFFARCFNVPEQNMLLKKFQENVCNDNLSIQCETFKSKKLGAKTEIKNPRFPHKKEDQEGISERDKKVLGIVIVTVLGCVIIVMFISFIRWMRQRGHCVSFKNFIVSSNSSCGTLCDRVCGCTVNNDLDNARSISQLSVNEYSERHRLNEPRTNDTVQETILPNTYTEHIITTENKTTQTLPEELTKELLENLKEKLEDPENYVEAREMIEHLYELIKVEESCNNNTTALVNVEENIYELPFQNTIPRIGKNKKQMISTGTRTPSLDKLMPLSPYNRQTALVHEYFEPKDFAVHLYAEIANCEKEKNNFLSVMPDVVGEQAVPRGPYLRAVRDKMNICSSATPQRSLNSLIASPQAISTIKSNKSTASNNSGKMINRPLPEKPAIDPGEGTSFRHG